MEKETICIHGQNREKETTGAVSVPIYMTATFAHPGVGRSTGYDYSRTQNPTREYLEKTVAELEHGCGAIACSTGMAAITAVMELFLPGDHIVISDDLYGGTYRLFHTVNEKNGLSFTAVNTSDTSMIEECIGENTKAIYIETPSNPTMQITDIAAVSEIARRRKLLLIVDNTFLTPYLQNPICLGATIVVHSGTKYLCGHNDTLAGFIVTDSEEILKKLRFIYNTTGASLSPMDSWLLIRGLKTLAIRMDRQQENAMKMAEWLEAQKAVEKVFYAGLPTHPGRDLAARQARGFGAMLSFTVKEEKLARYILEHVKLIQYAESLGGVETLITYPMLQTHADIPEQLREEKGIHGRLLRLSVGIENIKDLIHDLEKAMRWSLSEKSSKEA